MKKFLVTLLIVCLCATFVNAALADGPTPSGGPTAPIDPTEPIGPVDPLNGWLEGVPFDPGCGDEGPYPPGESLPEAMYLPGESLPEVSVEVSVSVDFGGRCNHHPGCPHWETHERVKQVADDGESPMAKSCKISAERARRAIKDTKLALEATNWTVTEDAKLHALSCNGWEVLTLKCKKWGLEEKYVINAYTHDSQNGRNRDRWIIFTKAHLGGPIADYDEDYKITSEEVYASWAISELIDHLEQLEAEAAAAYLVDDAG